MTCETRIEQTPDFLAGELDAAAEGTFRAHLAACEACREEVESLLELWARLDLLPEEAPSPAVRAGFYARLEAYRAGHSDIAGPLSRPGRAPVTRSRPLWRGLAAAGLLAAGTLVGLRLQRPAPVMPEALTAQEADRLRHQASVALLARPQAGDRLRGLALVSASRRADPTLLPTLMETLEGDPSVPVRLAAVDALFLFADTPGARERLLAALQKEPSPLVQAALIDLLVGLREKRAAEALKRLAGDPRVLPEVRQRAETGLQRLL